MEGLSEFELEVLENLPVEPVGLSLTELADGLLDNRSPGAKGKVRRALESISKALGGLHVRTGNDELGGFAVKMYGVPRDRIASVRSSIGMRSARIRQPSHHA